MRNQQNIQGIRRLLLIQLSLTVLAAMLFTATFSLQSGISAFLGGCVSVLPNAYFAKKLFHYQGAKAAQKIVKSFYQGEALKIGMSIALFACVFKFCAITPWVFFATYIMAQLVFWFTPFMFAQQKA